MLIKICLTTIIVSMLVFIITLLLIKFEVFFKKYIRSETEKEQKFWLRLDSIVGYICFSSFVIVTSFGITLLMTLIWR